MNPFFKNKCLLIGYHVKETCFRLQYPLQHSLCRIYTPSQSLVEESLFVEPLRETENWFQKSESSRNRDCTVGIFTGKTTKSGLTFVQYQHFQSRLSLSYAQAYVHKDLTRPTTRVEKCGNSLYFRYQIRLRTCKRL